MGWIAIIYAIGNAGPKGDAVAYTGDFFLRKSRTEKSRTNNGIDLFIFSPTKITVLEL